MALGLGDHRTEPVVSLQLQPLWYISLKVYSTACRAIKADERFPLIIFLSSLSLLRGWVGLRLSSLIDCVS